MLDTRKVIVNKLKEVISNVQFELSVESPTFPLITYMTIDDSVFKYGNTLGYSNVKYRIKYWTTSVADLATKMETIDEKLKEIGLKRTFYTELTNNDIVIGSSQYGGLVYEEFN